MSDAIENIQQHLRDANDMVHNLCRPRGTVMAREWMMSIPARPDYDPDLVIGAAPCGGIVMKWQGFWV